MSVDINEKVLAAFQAEHKEQLEGIRALLTTLDGTQDGEVPNCIDEAYRLAHSLKGGARVCDLRPAEALAHKLENVFEYIRSGELRLGADVVKTINVVLDAIEDWMAALGRDEQPTASQEALNAVERLLGCDAQATSEPVTAEGVAERLLQAFRCEYPQYLKGLRQFAAVLHSGGELTSDELAEAFRLAHNLRGSAQAVGIELIANEGEALESLIADLRDHTVATDAEARARVKQHCDTIGHELTQLAANDGGDFSRVFRQQDTSSATTSAESGEIAKESPVDTSRPAGSVRHSDTVRISTESLDKLLRSSRQLVSDSVHQQQMSGALDDIRSLVNQMQRDRELIRRVAAGSMHGLTNISEFNGLAAYFETVDRNVQSLARQTRSLCALQKRIAWQLRSRGRQIQQDVQQARMVPAEVVFQGLRKLVRDLAKEEDKQVTFRVSGFDVRADRMVFQSLKDPLIHMLRNCVVHGIEPRDQRLRGGKNESSHIELCIETRGNRLIIEVDDDGRGIDRARIASRAVERGLITRDDVAALSEDRICSLIFQPGFSTSDEVSEIAGRGMGLSVVRDAVARLQGDVQICHKESAGTKFRITIPLCLSSHRLLLVSAAEQRYAIPLHGIERLLRIKAADLESIEGKPVVSFRDRPVALVSLAHLLGLPDAHLKINGDELCIAVLKSGARRLAVNVDAFLAESESLIQDLDGVAMSDQYLGAVVLEDTSVALVLNPAELLAGARPTTEKIVEQKAQVHAEKRKPRVLVVDDSFTTRTLEKSILEANGYQVGIAVDGVEGLNQLKSEHYDLVISDIEMPRMDGFTLLQEIKQNHRLASIPVILVTSRTRREDQAKGLELGAEAYIVKQKFDHQSLLNTIRQVVDVEHGHEHEQDPRHDH